MQLNEISIVITNFLPFIPCLILSLLYLLELQKQNGQYHRIALFGFSTFTVFALYFLSWAIRNYMLLLLGVVETYTLFRLVTIGLYDAGLILLTIWTLAITFPEWLTSRSRTVIVVSLTIWVAFFGFSLVNHLIVRIIVTTILFLFILFLILIKTTDTKTTYVLLFGLSLFYFYLTFGWIPISITLTLHDIAHLGLWLVFIWYIIDKKQYSEIS